MKRYVLFCLAIVLVFSVASLPLNALAVSIDHISAADVSFSDVADIWIDLRDSGKLLVNEQGLFYVEENEYANTIAYKRFLQVVEHCNIAIAEGVLVATEENSVQIADGAIVDYEQALEDLDEYYTLPPRVDAEDIGVDEAQPFAAHCSAQSVNVLSICESNYQFLVTHYDSMMIVQMTDPTFNAWLSTVSLWISRVRPNGSWDYKVSSTYGPYNNPLCSYYGGTYHHFTAEYFGNLNYGYTGSFLFNLNTLHFGSSAVSGFDPADESDWPAIDEGYYLKTG